MLKKTLLALVVGGSMYTHLHANAVTNLRVAKLERYNETLAGCNPEMTKMMFVQFKTASGEVYKPRNEDAGEWFLLYETSPGYKDMLAMLMTAMTTGSLVEIRHRNTENCSAKNFLQGVSLAP